MGNALPVGGQGAGGKKREHGWKTERARSWGWGGWEGGVDNAGHAAALRFNNMVEEFFGVETSNMSIDFPRVGALGVRPVFF